MVRGPSCEVVTDKAAPKLNACRRVFEQEQKTLLGMAKGLAAGSWSTLTQRSTNEKAGICGFGAPTSLGRNFRRLTSDEASIFVFAAPTSLGRNLRGSTSHGWGTSEGGRKTDGEEDGTVREGGRNLPFCECG